MSESRTRGFVVVSPGTLRWSRGQQDLFTLQNFSNWSAFVDGTTITLTYNRPRNDAAVFRPFTAIILLAMFLIFKVPKICKEKTLGWNLVPARRAVVFFLCVQHSGWRDLNSESVTTSLRKASRETRDVCHMPSIWRTLVVTQSLLTLNDRLFVQKNFSKNNARFGREWERSFLASIKS